MYKVTKSFQLWPEINSKMLAVGTIIECGLDVYEKHSDCLEPIEAIAKPVIKKETKKKAISDAFDKSEKRVITDKIK